MQDKHTLFISTMQKMCNDENRSLLECVTKSYIINEGLADFVTSGYRRMKDWASQHAKPAFQKLQNSVSAQPERKPTTVFRSQYDQEMLRKDRESYAEDYADFKKACKSLLNYLVKYGSEEYREDTNSPEFTKCYNRGIYLDKLRPNPVHESRERIYAFNAVLESLRTPSNSFTIDSVKNAYVITESEYDFDITPLMEAVDEIAKQFDKEPSINPEYIAQTKDEADMKLHNEIMPEIKEFLEKHGVAPWFKMTRNNIFASILRYADKVTEKLKEMKLA